MWMSWVPSVTRSNARSCTMRRSPVENRTGNPPSARMRNTGAYNSDATAGECTASHAASAVHINSVSVRINMGPV